MERGGDAKSVRRHFLFLIIPHNLGIIKPRKCGFISPSPGVKMSEHKLIGQVRTVAGAIRAERRCKQPTLQRQI